MPGLSLGKNSRTREMKRRYVQMKKGNKKSNEVGKVHFRPNRGPLEQKRSERRYTVTFIWNSDDRKVEPQIQCRTSICYTQSHKKVR